ncbi:MAG: flagellar protein FlgN [Pseudomonas sp.]|uniref:flagella synthesis protein FlgN n=1 Tax=Pseudomonas sp. TaxID=306 RepID=UPI0027331727|nr:flagellar protein FlgN [Pseudomonas sp.]MDP3846041.1 flagellar protein FlgN [Pseudomonas sp.]
MHDTEFLQQLHDDIGIAQQLLELIQAEFAALGERDLAHLDQILSAKLPLLSQLDQHGRQRSQRLLSLQLTADLAGLQQLAAQSALGAELLTRSDELGTLLEQCQSANLRNGRLIRANQSTVGSVLGILRGNETPSLYDSRGSTARIAHQRPLSQA